MKFSAEIEGDAPLFVFPSLKELKRAGHRIDNLPFAYRFIIWFSHCNCMHISRQYKFRGLSECFYANACK